MRAPIISSLSPNQTRLIYDAFVLTLSSLIASLFDFVFLDQISYRAFVLPLLALFSMFILGIYGRNRASSFQAKTLLIAFALLLTVAFSYLLTVELRHSILWCLIAWSPLVLPRIFLGIRPRPTFNKMAHSFKEIVNRQGPVLVVGGAGYIGSHVVHQLLAEKRIVRVLDRFYYGKGSLQSLIEKYPTQLEIEEGDVTDIGKLVSAVDGCSAIVHLAGLVGDPACAIDERASLHCNIVATRMLYEVARSFGVPRFLFASSCSVYGASAKTVDETSPLQPVSLYSRTKIESEKELLSAIDDYFIVTILRFATVFGHSFRPRFDLVANLFAAMAIKSGKIIVHGGKQWRPFIHVSDVARAVVMALKAPPTLVQGQIYNVGDQRLNTPISDLAYLVAEIVSKFQHVEVTITPEILDARDYNVSFSKIKNQLGFESLVSLEEGIRELVEKLLDGSYEDYRSAQYNNFETTKMVVEGLHDPQQSAKLYAPINQSQIKL